MVVLNLDWLAKNVWDHLSDGKFFSFRRLYAQINVWNEVGRSLLVRCHGRMSSLIEIKIHFFRLFAMDYGHFDFLFADFDIFRISLRHLLLLFVK